MFDSTTAKAALAIGDSDRTGTPSPSFPPFQLPPSTGQPIYSSTFKPLSVWTCQRSLPYPLFFTLLRTLLRYSKSQPFSFQWLPTSLHKTTRVVGRDPPLF